MRVEKIFSRQGHEGGIKRKNKDKECGRTEKEEKEAFMPRRLPHSGSSTRASPLHYSRHLEQSKPDAVNGRYLMEKDEVVKRFALSAASAKSADPSFSILQATAVDNSMDKNNPPMRQ